jgi:methyltransferase (TIGR00027 family)
VQPGQPSETAYRANKARARHQFVDQPRIFEDPIAERFVRPEDAEELRAGGRGSPLARGMRMALAARHRIAEDALRVAVKRGVRQYVLLGAGLDTFAWRLPAGCESLRVFEVDHPDTQAAKREAAIEAGLAAPSQLLYVPVDFAREDFWDRLRSAQFDSAEPAFFALLGVSVYLERQSLLATLDTIAARAAPGSEIVFDYVVPPARLPWIDRWMLHLAAWRVARLGEPWRTFVTPEEMAGWLSGFSQVEPVRIADFEARIRAEHGIPEGRKPPRFGMGRMMRAVVCNVVRRVG